MSLRKTIARNIAPAGSSAEMNGLLTGETKMQDAAASLKPVSKLPFSSIRTTAKNPRYLDLVAARIIQPAAEADDDSRRQRPTHVSKLSRNRAVEWAARNKGKWLVSEAGKAWVASETKNGHTFNFESPDEREKDNIWRARMRRWLSRVTRTLTYFAGNDPEAKARVEFMLSQWNELMALAATIQKDGLITPVRVRPVDGHFEVVAGERRYWACRLASIDFIQVVGGEISSRAAMSQTLHENLDRLNVSLPGWVSALRAYMAELTGEPCGPDNKQLKISLFETEFAGRSRSWNHRWRGVCKLPADSKVLADIQAGVITTVNGIDEEVRAYHRNAKAGLEQGRQTGQEEHGQPPKKPEEAPPRNSPAGQDGIPTTSVKVRLPGTEAGVRLLSAIKTIDGVDAATEASLERALAGWRGAPENARKKLLEEVLTTLAVALDPLDEVEN